MGVIRNPFAFENILDPGFRRGDGLNSIFLYRFPPTSILPRKGGGGVVLIRSSNFFFKSADRQPATRNPQLYFCSSIQFPIQETIWSSLTIWI